MSEKFQCEVKRNSKFGVNLILIRYLIFKLIRWTFSIRPQLVGQQLALGTKVSRSTLPAVLWEGELSPVIDWVIISGASRGDGEELHGVTDSIPVCNLHGRYYVTQKFRAAFHSYSSNMRQLQSLKKFQNVFILYILIQVVR